MIRKHRMRRGNRPRRPTQRTVHFHGLSSHPLYGVWSMMISRCYNPNHKSYKWYGGRGITVCQRWLDSIADWISDMGPRPSPHHTIERLDNDGPYSPTNCCWIAKAEQTSRARRDYPSEMMRKIAQIRWSRST